MPELLGIRAYARLRGVSHSAVQKAIASGRLSDSLTRNDGGSIKIDPDAATAEWSENTNSTLRRPAPRSKPSPRAPGARPAIVAPAPAGPNFAQSHAIREAYLAKTARLNYEQLAGTLVRVDEVQAQAFKVHRTARDAFLLLPERVTAEVFAAESVHEVHEVLVREINAVLQEMVDAEKRS